MKNACNAESALEPCIPGMAAKRQDPAGPGRAGSVLQ